MGDGATAIALDATHPTAAPPPTRAIDPDRVNAMSVAELMAVIGGDPDVAAQVTRLRPMEAGEVVQAAYRAGRTATAAAMLAAMRFDLLQTLGSSTEAQLLVRSVMRLTGPGSAEVKAALHAVIDELHQIEASSNPLGQSYADVDGLNGAIDLATKDPESGRVVANFYDRPDDVVSQLLQDAGDAATLERREYLVASLIEVSSGPGGWVIDALAARGGEPATSIKLSLLKRLDRKIAHELAEIQAGRIAEDPTGGPWVRAERLVPLVAQLMAQPDVATVLTDLQAGSPADPDTELRTLLRHVLLAAWSDATHERVHQSIARGAADMFHDSLLARDPIDRNGAAIRTTEFLGTAARIEVEVGIEHSMAKAIGSMLQTIAKFLPGPYKQGGVAAAMVISAVGMEEEPAWTRDVLDQLMRAVYESVNPPPRERAGAELERYENEYREWSAVPKATYSDLATER